MQHETAASFIDRLLCRKLSVLFAYSIVLSGDK